MQNKSFTSKVITGHGRGKLLGFPTLNLKSPKNLQIPHGIYAGWVTIKSKQYMGAFHYGPVPTFKSPEPSLEVFILNKNLDQTPARVTFQLIKRLRSIKNFASPQALSSQIKKDVSQTKHILQKL